MTKNKKQRFLLMALFAFSFFAVSWTLSPRNGLIFDDYSLLSQARFSGYQDLFSMLPSNSYNDRSIRMMFLKLMQQLFGENYLAYHIVFVAMHLWNVYLVYCVTKLMLTQAGKAENTEFYGIIAAGVFGIFPTSLLTVQWISATCDFQCCNFLLLSILWYLKARENKQYRVCYVLLCFMAYWLSLRCKEMSLALPVIFVIYEIALCIKKKIRFSFSWSWGIPFAFMLFYAVLLFTGGQDEMSWDNPYYMDFNLLIMLRNAIRYAILYLNPFDGAMAFEGYKNTSWVAIALFAAFILYSLYALIRKRHPWLFLCFLAIAGSLVVVLPMRNMQHRLYLYVPSVFIGIFAAVLFCETRKKLENHIAEAALTVLIVCYLFTYATGTVSFKNYWLAVCDSDADSMKSIEKLEEIPPYTHVYVKGANEGYNILFYGPGNVLRMHFDDETLMTELVDSFPEEPQRPYLLLEYRNGEILEIERDDTLIPQAKIDSISKTTVEAAAADPTAFDIGLSGTYDWEDLEVRLNGVTVQHLLGSDFLSFTIPEELRIPGTQIAVTLYSAEGCGESEPVYIAIQ